MGSWRQEKGRQGRRGLYIDNYNNPAMSVMASAILGGEGREGGRGVGWGGWGRGVHQGSQGDA